MGSREAGSSWSLAATLWVSVCLLSKLSCLMLCPAVSVGPSLALSVRQVCKRSTNGAVPPPKQYTLQSLQSRQAHLPGFLNGFLAPSWISVLGRKKLLVTSPKVQTVAFSPSYINNALWLEVGIAFICKSTNSFVKSKEGDNGDSNLKELLFGF